MSADLQILIKTLQDQMAQQQEQHQQQVKLLIDCIQKSESKNNAQPAKFSEFDPSSELVTDYLARFQTFVSAHSIPEHKQAQFFLTSQTPVTYKMICNLSSQTTPPKEVNELTLQEIEGFMKEQFHPTRFIVRERYKFWTGTGRKPGESIQQLAARIRQDAVTCDFPSITNHLDEAMRTRFMCHVDNEAVLKALFKMKKEDLTFLKAIEIATQIEDAAKCAKETVSQERSLDVHTVQKQKFKPSKNSKRSQQTKIQKKRDFPEGTCGRCGNSHSKPCRFKESVCNYCQKVGHLEKVCLSKKKQLGGQGKVKTIINPVKPVFHINDPKLRKSLKILGKMLDFEIDTGAGDNFISYENWQKLGKPQLQPCSKQFESASQHPLPVFGILETSISEEKDAKHQLQFVVTKVPGLNLLGRSAIRKLDISVDRLIQNCHSIKTEEKNIQLEATLKQMCTEFSQIFEPGLGQLKDFELDVKFKENASPVYVKPRPVPFAVMDKLNEAYDAGIKKGVWKPVQFNSYGTPVVPVRKNSSNDQKKSSIRVCGDYSVTVNPQLEPHRYPIPLPSELMRKLGGGHFFTKIDLADAYNQIMLSPESQKKLALSTHRGVLLQQRLPFGITSAPGYFQEIIDQLTQDLNGVAAYIDDILVGGSTAEEHLSNVRNLFQRLHDKGLRCRLDKCVFAKPSIEYLGYILSKEGIAKGPKVDAVISMPAPENVSELKSFLGQIQFYSKFLEDLSTVLEPLNRLQRKNVSWHWGAEEQAAFQTVKTMLCTDNVLAHFDPSLPIGIACDASSVGVGAVLFHRYSDGSERPIANISKTLNSAQRKYSQIQKEALAIIFALSKFHQFLFGKKFILVTDHKPLLSIFSPTKAIPSITANRLARWALTLSQYEYEIEYRKTSDHGNADALSRLPKGPDTIFDSYEDGADVDTICTIQSISKQLKPTDPGILRKETEKDKVLATIMRFCREGWPKSEKEWNQFTRENNFNFSVKTFKRLRDSLSSESGCLLYGTRIVIPQTLQSQVLNLLHLGHFGMERMKQLARTSVYWPGLDQQIEELCRSCQSCAEHQNSPVKAPVHPWMMPEKPWSRVHIDHAINFMGSNWLIVVDAYSKYPCIHPCSSVGTKTTTELLETDFAHFGYPHTIVSDNAPSFSSDEFKAFCRERGIVHLTGAPYHPATNGAAERMIQSFKKSLKKSALPPRKALQEFLMQYRRTPLSSGISPSEILNGRQIRTKIDTLRPSIPHLMQNKLTIKSKSDSHVTQKRFKVGDPCFATVYRPRAKSATSHTKSAKWVPATVVKVFGARSFNIKVYPNGPIWRRHLDQLRPRVRPDDDEADPGELPAAAASPATASIPEADTPAIHEDQRQPVPSPGVPIPRRSGRNRKAPSRLDL